jgi:ABC-type oligopeptide transport system substrate-binding subunit
MRDTVRKRFELFARAERILMDELPIIPFYFYVSKSLVKPYVRGFYNNVQDAHPLSAIWFDRGMTTPSDFFAPPAGAEASQEKGRP